MNQFLDWRFTLFVLLPLFVFAILLIRNYTVKHHWRSVFDDLNGTEATIIYAVFFILSLFMWTFGRDLRINNFSEQIGGFVTNIYAVDGQHEESEEVCSGSGDDRHCTTHYYTVYHRDYFVENNTGDWWSGSKWSQRVDKSCEACDVPAWQIPAYYQTAYIGKPVSLDHQYPNYIAARYEDNFKAQYNEYASYLTDICPAYNYIKVDSDKTIKAFALGFDADNPINQEVYNWNFAPIQDASQYPNATSSNQLPLYMDTQFGYIGKNVQADTYIYVLNSTDTQYGNMCMAKWRNGSKNGVYVFIYGSYDGSQYKVFDVSVHLAVDGTKKNTGLVKADDAERNNYKLKQDIRNEILDYVDSGNATLSKDVILGIVFDKVEHEFVRQEMATYKNEKEYVIPTNGYMVFLYIFGYIVLGFALFVASNNDE